MNGNRQDMFPDIRNIIGVVPEHAISTVKKYIRETGDVAFLDKEIVFGDENSHTVYEYLKSGIQNSIDRLGPYDAVSENRFFYALDDMMGFAREKKDISLICSLGEVKGLRFTR